MDRRLASMTYPTAAAAAAVGLVAGLAGGPGRLVASILLIAAAAGPFVLAVWGPRITGTGLDRQHLGVYGLLIAFNMFLLASILVEVGALIVLVLQATPRVSPAESAAVWLLPAGLAGFQAIVLMERRSATTAASAYRTQRVLAAVLAGVGALAWLNALTAGTTRLFFVTGHDLAPAQGVYMLLLGHVFVALSAMVLFRVPALFELFVNRRDDLGRLRAVTGASPLMTSLLIAAVALLVAIMATVGRDRIPWLGTIVPAPAWARGLFIIVFVLAIFLVAVGTMSVRRSRRPLFRRKLEPRQRDLIIIGAVTGVLAIFFLWLVVSLYSEGIATVFRLRVTDAWRHEAVVLAILATTGPAGFYLHREHRRNQVLEERLADFLADLAESANAGLSLHAALQGARRKDYGPLGDEIALMATQASWGMTFEEVFSRFGQRSRSTMVKRTANLVVESSRSGGNTADVLKAAARDVFEIKSLDAERRIAMTTYLIVIYVVFLVFLAILAVLAIAFLPPLIEATQAAGGGSGAFAGTRFDADALRAAYFHAVLVQAVGNGAVAGVIRENRFSAGLRHMFLMVVMAYLVFKMLIL